MVTFQTGMIFANTEVGGLSAIVYDPAADHYYILSDDRSERNNARFYTATIDLVDGRLDEGDVTLTAVTILLDRTGQPFAAGTIDAEGMALSNDGTLFISSEGDPTLHPPALPFIKAFGLDGQPMADLSLPDKFLPSAEGTHGVRENGALESVTIRPDQRYLYTATEEALAQDGPSADFDRGTLARILQFDLQTNQPAAEYVYFVEPIPSALLATNLGSSNGLSDLLAVDDAGTFLALERSYVIGVGNTIRLYQATTEEAKEVQTQDALRWEDETAVAEANPSISKTLLLDFADLGIAPDNLEGMTFGPRLADGRRLLVVISDNNFNPLQTTQFIALALPMK
jgi:3-phytase/alkaline phosphatase D